MARTVVWAPQPGSQDAFLSCPVPEVLIEGNRGGGKGLPLNEPVLCPDGWRSIGDLVVGDEVCTPDGGTARVMGIFPQGERDCYTIKTRDGRAATCDDVHLWKVRTTNGWRVWPMEKLLQERRDPLYLPTLDSECAGSMSSTPLIDPYLLGLLLGDGVFSRSGYVRFCGVDDELCQFVKQHGFDEHVPDRRTGVRSFNLSKNQKLFEVLDDLGMMRKLAHEKRIPDAVMRGPRNKRLALLQGLMDTDGAARRGGSSGSIGTASPEMARQIQELAWSLGAVASRRVKKTTHRDSHVVEIQPGNKFPLFRLRRKLEAMRPYMHQQLTVRVESIAPVGKRQTTCIKLDSSDGLFITRDYVVTHNTDALLMDFAQHVGRGFDGEWRGILFRKTYKQLSDVVEKTKKWFPRIWPAATFNRSDMYWGWPTGERLFLRYMEREDDYENYHGHSYPWIGWEELTTWPSDRCYRVMMSTWRTPHPDVPKKYRSTTNPYGPGHNWVRRRFQLPIPHGKLAGPVIREGDDPPRLAIRSRLDENKKLVESDPRYVKSIAAAARSEAERRAWVEGDWDIVAGGLFDDVWEHRWHVIPIVPFEAIPRRWRLDRAYDHGQSKPFSVGWWAESNGEPIRAGGRIVGQVPGDLIRIAEWYGWSGVENEGLRMLSRDIARGILEREADWGMAGRFAPGPADSSIFDPHEGHKSVAGEMRAGGVKWLPCDKGPGSRKQGWGLMRDLLFGAVPGPDGTREHPGLFISARCGQFLRTVPVLPRSTRDPDDADTDAEDHIADEARYRVRSRAKVAMKSWGFDRKPKRNRWSF